jgi:molybdopterin synthase catalytic subunit
VVAGTIRDDDTWVGITHEPLPVATVAAWATRPDCGAVVTFTGTVRDHSEGRAGVDALSYEAYEEPAVARMGGVVDDVRRRWPTVRGVAVLHRLGPLVVGDAAVVVAVSSPHRADAFAAAAWCIDTLKATVPIWKRERWAGGAAWGADAVPVADSNEAAR